MSVSGLTGIAPNNYPINVRAIVDNNWVVNVAFPTSSTNSVTANLDLGDKLSGVPYVTTEIINVGVSSTASNNGNASLVYFTLEDASANSDGTANTATWATIVTTGAANLASSTAGTPACSVTFKLPPGTKRFIRAKCTNPSANVLTDATMTMSLLF
jgi:hypothetical protein